MRYWVLKPFRSDTISVTFDYNAFPGQEDAFFPFVLAYAKEFDLKELKAVDEFYQYKFYDDEFDLRFIWNGNFTIYIYVPVRRHYEEVERRAHVICNKLNRYIWEHRNEHFFNQN